MTLFGIYSRRSENEIYKIEIVDVIAGVIVDCKYSNKEQKFIVVEKKRDVLNNKRYF